MSSVNSHPLNAQVKWVHQESPDSGNIKILGDLTWKEIGNGKVTGVQVIQVKIPHVDENGLPQEDLFEEMEYEIKINNITNSDSAKLHAEEKMMEQVKKMATLAVLFGLSNNPSKRISYASVGPLKGYHKTFVDEEGKLLLKDGKPRVKSLNINSINHNKINIHQATEVVDPKILNEEKQAEKEKLRALAEVVNHYVEPWINPESPESAFDKQLHRLEPEAFFQSNGFKIPNRENTSFAMSIERKSSDPQDVKGNPSLEKKVHLSSPNQLGELKGVSGHLVQKLFEKLNENPIDQSDLNEINERVTLLRDLIEGNKKLSPESKALLIDELNTLQKEYSNRFLEGFDRQTEPKDQDFSPTSLVLDQQDHRDVEQDDFLEDSARILKNQLDQLEIVSQQDRNNQASKAFYDASELIGRQFNKDLLKKIETNISYYSSRLEKEEISEATHPLMIHHMHWKVSLLKDIIDRAYRIANQKNLPSDHLKVAKKQFHFAVAQLKEFQKASILEETKAWKLYNDDLNKTNQLNSPEMALKILANRGFISDTSNREREIRQLKNENTELTKKKSKVESRVKDKNNSPVNQKALESTLQRLLRKIEDNKKLIKEYRLQSLNGKNFMTPFEVVKNHIGYARRTFKTPPFRFDGQRTRQNTQAIIKKQIKV